MVWPSVLSPTIRNDPPRTGNKESFEGRAVGIWIPASVIPSFGIREQNRVTSQYSCRIKREIKKHHNIVVLVLTDQPIFMMPALLMNESELASRKDWRLKSLPRFL